MKFASVSLKMRAKVYILNKEFKGYPNESDFTLNEEELPPLKDQEYLAEAVYLSVDPYMRTFSRKSDVGKTFFGEQVAKVIDSRNTNYPIGKFVVGEFGWRTLTVASNETAIKFPLKPRILEGFDDIPKSLALGVLGMPGNTAYFGFLKTCNPENGNTVAVTAAAGAVGSLVGQIAKIKGCRVIGIAGTSEKCQWIKDELGFDTALNYRDSKFNSKLSEASPNGLDCYYDNVGGEISSLILSRIKEGGKVAICGSISTYNVEKKTSNTKIEKIIRDKNLMVHDVNVFKYKDSWNEGITQNKLWLKEGKLKYRETVTKGFENMPKAFIGMLKGENIGKAIVEI